MRKLILSMITSIDGFVAMPDGNLDWADANEEHHAYANALIQSADLAIFGRTTYEVFAGYWPTAPDDPDTPTWEVEYAHLINRTPKLVFSRTLESVGWNARLLREVDPNLIESMKREPGKDMLIYASANLAQTFMRHNLIDEYQLLMQPIVLGEGIPLFKPDIRLKLTLAASRAFGTGAILLTYRPA